MQQFPLLLLSSMIEIVKMLFAAIQGPILLYILFGFVFKILYKVLKWYTASFIYFSWNDIPKIIHYENNILQSREFGGHWLLPMKSCLMLDAFSKDCLAMFCHMGRISALHKIVSLVLKGLSLHGLCALVYAALCCDFM